MADTALVRRYLNDKRVLLTVHKDVMHRECIAAFRALEPQLIARGAPEDKLLLLYQ